MQFIKKHFENLTYKSLNFLNIFIFSCGCANFNRDFLKLTTHLALIPYGAHSFQFSQDHPETWLALSKHNLEQKSQARIFAFIEVFKFKMLTFKNFILLSGTVEKVYYFQHFKLKDLIKILAQGFCSKLYLVSACQVSR